MANVERKVVADESVSGRELIATANPQTRAGVIPLTGEGGSVTIDAAVLESVAIGAEGATIGSPESLVIDGSEVLVALNVQADTVGGLAIQTFAANAPAEIYGVRAQGAAEAPLIVDAADVILKISACSHDGVDLVRAGYLQFAVDGTPDEDEIGCRADLFLCPDGSNTAQLVLSARQDKSVEFAGEIVPAATQRVVHVLTETVLASDLVDGLAEFGTLELDLELPLGARFLFAQITEVVGFAGDVSATVKLGDGVDDDRYMTGAPSVFATDAAGVELGDPSGARRIKVANSPVVTIESDADITPVLAGGGSFVVEFHFIPPAA